MNRGTHEELSGRPSGGPQHLREMLTVVDQPPVEIPLVLVVDDSPYITRALTAVLRHEFRVETAADGNEGLAKAIALSPDLIITDIMMPNMDGESLVRELRSRPELDMTPIVVQTASADEKLAERLLGIGVQDFVAKPVSGHEVLARVRNLVALKRAGDVLRRELSSKATNLETLANELVREKKAMHDSFHAMCATCNKVVQASQAKTTFLGLVSHELTTPLQSMRLSIELLNRQRAALSTSQAESVERIARAADRLRTMFESLLEFVRIESGKLDVREESVSLQAIAESVVDDLAPLAEKKRLELRVRPNGETPPAHTDPKLARLIVANLVGNAIKYTDEGHVHVAVEHDDRAFRVNVEDTGCGVPTAELTRIFEPFTQLERIEMKRSPGVGLGLTLARELAEALHGRITVSSDRGHGSTFTLVLPRS